MPTAASTRIWRCAWPPSVRESGVHLTRCWPIALSTRRGSPSRAAGSRTRTSPDPGGDPTAASRPGSDRKPDADRLTGANAADRVAVYTTRTLSSCCASSPAAHPRGAEIPIYAIDRALIADAIPLLDRRTALSVPSAAGRLPVPERPEPFRPLTSTDRHAELKGREPINRTLTHSETTCIPDRALQKVAS